MRRCLNRAFGMTLAASGLFALALFLGDAISVWLTTGVAAAISLALCRWWGGFSLRAMLGPYLPGLLRGIFGGLVLSGAMHLVYPLALRLVPALEGETGRLYAMLDAAPGASWIALPILTLVVVAEECVWRGVLYGALAESLGRERAVVLSVVAYVLPQIGSRSWVTALLALFCGTVWTAQRALAGSLLEPVVSHWLWSSLVLLAFPVGR